MRGIVLVGAVATLTAVLVAQAPEARPRPHNERLARTVITRVFGDRAPAALRVVRCETGGTFDPRSLGRAGERGWFQIHPVHFRTTVTWRGRDGAVIMLIYVNPDALYDPTFNSLVAYALSRGGRDWGPWTCRP